MYSIPNTFDIDLLKRQVVQQVCYTSNTISIHLGGVNFIQIMGPFTFVSNGVVRNIGELYPLSDDYGLLVLLDKHIIEVKTNNNRNTLFLAFEGGSTLTLNSDEYYESFLVKMNGSEVLA